MSYCLCVTTGFFLNSVQSLFGSTMKTVYYEMVSQKRYMIPTIQICILLKIIFSFFVIDVEMHSFYFSLTIFVSQQLNNMLCPGVYKFLPELLKISPYFFTSVSAFYRKYREFLCQSCRQTITLWLICISLIQISIMFSQMIESLDNREQDDGNLREKSCSFMRSCYFLFFNFRSVHLRNIQVFPLLIDNKISVD